MKLIQKFKSYRAKRRKIRERRNQITELRMHLEILWDDFDMAAPESDNAGIIIRRIEELTAQLSLLHNSQQ